jgi:hypothetical protein
VGAVEGALRSRGYRRAWIVDTEYRSFGNHPQARCLCALDLLSGERREMWLAGVARAPCPFEMAADECFIFWAADADIGLFFALDWPIPRHVIDARVEFIRIRNGLGPLRPFEGGDPDIVDEKGIKTDKKRKKKPGKYSLIRVAWHYAIPFISDEEKGAFRDLAQRPGNDFTPAEQHGMIGYCHVDVDATAEVFRHVWRDAELDNLLTLNQALFRGFYMAVSAWVTHVGIPINLPLYRRLSMNATAIRLAFIASRGQRFDVHESWHFSFEKYAAFLAREGLLDDWPRTAKGRLAISGKALKKLAEKHPIIGEFTRYLGNIDLLESVGTSFDAHGAIEEDQDKSKGLRICPDGHNRAPLLPFTTKTSRNAPPGRAFLFTNSAWMRPLIQPREGRAVAYLDWKCQELRIAAARSGDPILIALCQRPDPYLELAIALGLAPEGATKESHPTARKAGKILTLAMLYGAGPGVVMAQIGLEHAYAEDLLLQTRRKFRIFYEWSDRFVHQCRCGAPLFSLHGWQWATRYWKDNRPPVRTARNFPVQATGADIMRLAAVRLFEARIRIAAIVHDAFLVEGPISEIERITQTAVKIMEGAAETVIGARIQVYYKITRHGETYYDEDGEDDFKLLIEMLEAIERQQNIA